MLRITRETDYGIVLLSVMARDTAQPHSAATLAESQQLPVPMVSKILKTLAREGLLESRRGAQGGYILARPPEAISAADIISALEGPIAITECTQDVPQGCVHQGHCGMSNHWHRINGAIRKALENISLSELSQLQAQPIAFFPREAVGLSRRLEEAS
ncbi:MAG TPA: SUF system Fe-S cluster assembly regulator [Candidatus Competibacteraceae bacterium]|nr:SUF system Fe-S cluster assembly regulator [Candidatus Competibacteraceae bacterium]